LLILSIKIIASLTTIQVKAINHIPKGIEYGFQVKNNQILTQSIANITEYKTIKGCLKESNWKTKIEKISIIAIKRDLIVEIIKSLFSSVSQDFKNQIHSGKS
jgi:hypothetical protein